MHCFRNIAQYTHTTFCLVCYAVYIQIADDKLTDSV